MYSLEKLKIVDKLYEVLLYNELGFLIGNFEY